MEYWNNGILEEWKTGRLEQWTDPRTGHWKNGMAEEENHGPDRSRRFSVFPILPSFQCSIISFFC
jgi:hypothetical protein